MSYMFRVSREISNFRTCPPPSIIAMMQSDTRSETPGPAAPSAAREEDLGLHRLHEIVLNNDLSALDRILAKGKVNIDIRTRLGETPLMLCLLMGNTAMMPTLVHAGASLTTNDRSGRSVIDYVNDANLLLSRMTTYAAAGYRPHPDATLKRENAKKHLASLPAAFAAKHNPEVGLTDLVFLTNNHKVAVFAPVFTAPLLPGGSGSKTVALIKRVRDPTFLRWAMSGWSPHDFVDAVDYLPKAENTQLVRDIEAILKYKFEPNRSQDHGIFGQFDACHAEKKVAAWWAVELLEKHCGTRDVTKLHMLKSIRIGDDDRNVNVVVGHEEVCCGCKAFICELNARTRLRITIDPMKRVSHGRAIRPVGVIVEGSPRPVTSAGEEDAQPRTFQCKPVAVSDVLQDPETTTPLVSQRPASKDQDRSVPKPSRGPPVWVAPRSFHNLEHELVVHSIEHEEEEAQKLSRSTRERLPACKPSKTNQHNPRNLKEFTYRPKQTAVPSDRRGSEEVERVRQRKRKRIGADQQGDRVKRPLRRGSSLEHPIILGGAGSSGPPARNTVRWEPLGQRSSGGVEILVAVPRSLVGGERSVRSG